MDLDRLWNSGIRFYINENIHVLEKEILAVRDGYMVYVACKPGEIRKSTQINRG